MMERYLLYILLSVMLFSSSSTESSVSHTHFFFSTVNHVYTYAFPFYYTTRSIDDITLYWYNSYDQVIERRVPWFKSTYYNLYTASYIQYQEQQLLQRNFKTITNYLNHTVGSHILQLLDGCVLYENGTYDTLYSLRYDGKPFLSFNVLNGKWTADDPRAQNLAETSNRNKTMTDGIKDYLLNKCIPHITELLSLGKNCMFNRREKPVVVVTLTPITNSMYKLNCRAYGHYPKKISMAWYKNGEPVSENLMEIVTLPLPEITYLTWLTMNITSKDDDVYTCNVTHSSLRPPFIANWRLSEESSGISGSSALSLGGIIGICIAAVVVLFMTVFGLVSFAKSRGQ